jgi:hypothetical protein
MIWKIGKKCKLKCEMIWKIWKKGKSNSEQIWKIQKKIVKRYEKYGKYGRKVFFFFTKQLILHVYSPYFNYPCTYRIVTYSLQKELCSLLQSHLFRYRVIPPYCTA